MVFVMLVHGCGITEKYYVFLEAGIEILDRSEIRFVASKC
jgi:hypothetical protein